VKDDKILYLPEDQDILEELENKLLGIEVSSESLKEMRRDDLAVLQIKSTLRSRKTMIDLDRSNRKFTLVLMIFAMVQIFIAGVQFIFDILNSTNKGYGIGMFLLLLAIIIFISFKMNKLFNGIK
jgi:hypothetical protein